MHEDVNGHFKDFKAARATAQMTGIAVAIRCAVRDIAGLETIRCRVCRVVVGHFKEIIDSYPAPFDLFRVAAGVADIPVDHADRVVSGLHPNPLRPDLDIIVERIGIGICPSEIPLGHLLDLLKHRSNGLERGDIA